MLEVNYTGSLRPSFEGAASVSIEAATIRDLFEKLAERFPNVQSHIDEGLAVSINGEIYRDDWGEKIPPNAEVFLLPRIPGG